MLQGIWDIWSWLESLEWYSFKKKPKKLRQEFMEWWSYFGCITCIEEQIHVPLFLNSVLDKLFCISKWESYNYEHLQFILGWPSWEKYSITGEALLCCFLEGWFVFTVSNMFDCGEVTVHEPRAPLCVAWRRLALLAELNLKWLQWYEIDHVCNVYS